jgi:hypothetical protein
MDFGDIFTKQTNQRDETPIEANNNDEDSSKAHDQKRAPEWADRRKTKYWTLPEYNTLAENAAFLNHQLEIETMGILWPRSQLHFGTAVTENDIRCIMDCIHWLLLSRRDEMVRGDQLNEQLVRLEKEIGRKNNHIQALSLRLESEQKVRDIRIRG